MRRKPKAPGMDFAAFLNMVRREAEPALLERGYALTAHRRPKTLEPVYRKVWEGWYLFVDFQYDEKMEVLDYRHFFVNTNRLKVDQPYGQFMRDETGKYIPGSIHLRVPQGLARFAGNHPLLATVSHEQLYVASWTYHSISELQSTLKDLVVPLLVEELRLLEDPTTTLGYE